MNPSLFKSLQNFLDYFKIKKCERLGLQIEPAFPWEKYQIDLSKQISSSQLPKTDTAIALIAASRADYFEQVVKSLKKNPETSRLPVFLFLDYSDEKIMDLHEKIIRAAGFPYLHIIRRPVNFGCGRNTIDARRQLFDHLGYQRVFVFEDDFVISPQYIGLCTHLMDWAETHYHNVGMVQGWNTCRESLSEKMKALDQVEGTFVNMWGYLMTRKCWESIKEILYRYERIFLRPEYSQRPHRVITQWAKLYLRKEGLLERKPSFPLQSEWEELKQLYFAKLPAGQDGITAMAFVQQGWVQLTTEVNRGRYIGEKGIHMNPTRFREEKAFHLVELHEFESDRDLKMFFPKQNRKAILPS